MQSFILTLLTSSAIMSVLSVCYMAVSPLLRKRYSAAGQYYAWLIIVLGLIIPFRPELGGGMVKITPSGTTAPVVQTANGTQLFSQVESSTVNTASAAVAAVPLSISWWQIAFTLWAVGVTAFLTYQAVKHYLFVKSASRWSEKVTDETTLALLESLKAELSISRKIHIYRSGMIGTPMLIGLKNPRILLPDKEFASDELYFILKHELVHYKRKDLWYKCLTLLAAAIHWFNPIVHLAIREIDMCCEASCDAQVVRGTDTSTRQLYTEAIIGVVRHQLRMKTALSTNFYGGMKGMKQRIYSILDTGKKRTGALILCIVLLLTVGTGAVFAVNTTNTDIKAVDLTNIDVSGKSDNYKLLAEMAELNMGMSVAEYNDTIVAMAEAEGTDIFSVTSTVLDEIYYDAGLGQEFSSEEEEYEALDRYCSDPVYAYMTTTLGYSSNEIYKKLIGGDEAPFANCNAYRGYPFSDEKEFTCNIYYNLVYNLPDDRAITIEERDKHLLDIIVAFQLYIDDLSEEAFVDEGITDTLFTKLEQLTKEHSDELMTISIGREDIVIDGYSEKYGDVGIVQEAIAEDTGEQDQASAQDSEQTETGADATGDDESTDTAEEAAGDDESTDTAEEGTPLTPEETAEMLSIYEPFGVTYDKEADTLYYDGKVVRELNDILSYGRIMSNGDFQGTLAGYYDDKGEINIRAVRDYANLDTDGYGKLIGIEVDI